MRCSSIWLSRDGSRRIKTYQTSPCRGRNESLPIPLASCGQLQERNNMCEFKSAIVLRDEREKGGFKLLLSPWTESHSDLEQIFKLRDGARLNYAKVEFTPKDMDKAYLPETYSLLIDEERAPEWFDAEMQEKVSERLRTYIKSIVVDGDVCLLIGGQFVVAPGARVECAKAC